MVEAAPHFGAPATAGVPRDTTRSLFVTGFGERRSLIKDAWLSLGEEQRMARWLDDHNAAITRRYMELRAAGGTAGH